MKSIFMKNNKLLIVLILFMQSICFAGFAQCPPPGGDQNLPEDNTPQTDWNTWEEEDIEVQAPIDPNEIIGLEGYNAPESTDTLRWVSAMQSLAYTIYFENDAELAMAAASKVTITVPLHEKLNFATFGVGSTYSWFSKSFMVASLTCIHDIMLEIPLAHCVRCGMVLPPSGIKPPRKHSLT